MANIFFYYQPLLDSDQWCKHKQLWLSVTQASCHQRSQPGWCHFHELRKWAWVSKVNWFTAQAGEPLLNWECRMWPLLAHVWGHSARVHYMLVVWGLWGVAETLEHIGQCALSHLALWSHLQSFCDAQVQTGWSPKLMVCPHLQYFHLQAHLRMIPVNPG